MKRQWITAIVWGCVLSTPVWAQSSSLFGGQDATTMQIDLLPEINPNVIKKRSGRVIPIAIMGSENLDTGAINPRTIRLQGVDVMLVGKSDKSLCRQLDLDNDGFLDLLCEVRTTGFRVGDGEYVIQLIAETYDKSTLRGEDKLRIEP